MHDLSRADTGRGARPLALHHLEGLLKSSEETLSLSWGRTDRPCLGQPTAPPETWRKTKEGYSMAYLQPTWDNLGVGVSYCA